MTDLAPERERKALLRHQATLDQARAAGLLGHAKNARITGRVSAKLVAAAKKQTGIKSDTGVIEVALATLALEDEFGSKLVGRKGSVSKDIDLGI